MASEILPPLAELPTADSWAGFRPRVEDDLPVIGPCESTDGLYVASGHYRNGILLAPITGELLARLISGAGSSSLLEPFFPNRFAGHEVAGK